MKRLASLLTVLAIASIFRADALTGRSVTDTYLSGGYESRLQELGTDRLTGAFSPERRKLYENGVKLHCARVLKYRGTFDPKCGGTTNVQSVTSL